MVSKMSLQDERNMSGNHSSDSSSLGSPLWSSPSPGSHATVPFSWEKQPGIPKHKGSSVRATRSKLTINFALDNHDELRPPPLLSRSSEAAGGNNYQSARPRHKTKKTAEVENGIQEDPFMAALVECTKQQNDQKIIAKAPEGSNKKKNNTVWSQLSSIFSCTGSSCSTRNSHLSFPVAKPVKLIRPDRTLSDFIRRAKGKMSNDQISDIPEKNYCLLHPQKQRGWMNNQSEGLAVEPAELKIERSWTMTPVAYGE